MSISNLRIPARGSDRENKYSQHGHPFNNNYNY